MSLTDGLSARLPAKFAQPAVSDAIEVKAAIAIAIAIAIDMTDQKACRVTDCLFACH